MSFLFYTITRKLSICNKKKRAHEQKRNDKEKRFYHYLKRSEIQEKRERTK